MQILIRIGVVSTTNPQQGTVRVAFPDRDNLVSDELPVLSIGGIFAMPRVGDPALCLFLGNDLGAGYYLGSFYTEGSTVPDTSQGAVVPGNLTVTGYLYGGGQP